MFPGLTATTRIRGHLFPSASSYDGEDPASGWLQCVPPNLSTAWPKPSVISARLSGLGTVDWQVVIGRHREQPDRARSVAALSVRHEVPPGRTEVGQRIDRRDDGSDVGRRCSRVRHFGHVGEVDEPSVAGTGSIERCSGCKVTGVKATGGWPVPGGMVEHQFAAPACAASCALSWARACWGTAGMRAAAVTAARIKLNRQQPTRRIGHAVQRRPRSRVQHSSGLSQSNYHQG